MTEQPTGGVNPATTSAAPATDVPDNPPTTGSAADAAPVDHAPTTEVDHEGTGEGENSQSESEVDGSDNA